MKSVPLDVKRRGRNARDAVHRPFRDAIRVWPPGHGLAWGKLERRARIQNSRRPERARDLSARRSVLRLEEILSRRPGQASSARRRNRASGEVPIRGRRGLINGIDRCCGVVAGRKRRRIGYNGNASVGQGVDVRGRVRLLENDRRANNEARTARARARRRAVRNDDERVAVERLDLYRRCAEIGVGRLRKRRRQCGRGERIPAESQPCESRKDCEKTLHGVALDCVLLEGITLNGG